MRAPPAQADLSLSARLLASFETHAERTALEVGGRALTYAQLAEGALATAGALRAAGAADETIAIVGQRRAASYVGILGILFAGCSYTPVNPKYSAARIAAVLRDARVRFIVGDREHVSAIEGLLAEPGMPEVTAFVLPDERESRGIWRGVTAADRLPAPEARTTKDLAYVLYTSGSTGAPKGVQVDHGNVLGFLRSMSAIYDLPPGFRASQTFDFSFDPSVSDMFFTWDRGGVLCVLPDEEIMMPSEFITRERITYWNSVPSIANFMRRLGRLKPNAFPELRYSMFCGEQFPQSLADAWRVAAPNSTIENLYGPTEATIYISRHAYEAHEAGREYRNGIVPIGRPFLDHRCVIVSEAGTPAPAGEVGEIVFSGPQVTRGYLGDPEKTARVFVTFPWDDRGARWYRTGDLGFVNPDGNVECIGRRDNQIKLAGRRIEIGEIEAALSRYPELRDIVVVPLRDAQEVVVGCAGFVTRALDQDTERRIRTESRQHLEAVFFPKQIFTIDRMPLSPSGKTDRKALERQAAERPGHATARS